MTHKATGELRERVERMASVGTTQEDIAKIIGVGINTLLKYYRQELDTACATANAEVGGALYDKAIGGNVTAQIFWMKTRAKWKEGDDSVKSFQPVINIINPNG